MKAQIIEKEGKFYKECGIVMLETTGMDRNKGILFKDSLENMKLTANTYTESVEFKDCPYFHLYITSDDKIEHGNWMTNLNGDTILKYDSKNEGDNTWRKCWRKIIATTDTSLFKDVTTVCKRCRGTGRTSGKYLLFIPCEVCGGSKTEVEKEYLPQPSDKFIQAYIDAYNKGEKIDKVLVEYEFGNISESYFDGKVEKLPLKPKLKDNNIIIKKMKQTWTREELFSILTVESLREHFHSQSGLFINKQTSYEIIEWIKEKL